MDKRKPDYITVNVFLVMGVVIGFLTALVSGVCG